MKAVAKGIDVSKWQGKIDWEQVKNAVDFVILRAGFGGDYRIQDDETFFYHAGECKRLAIPFGAYLYSYADTLKKAESEAQHLLRLVKGMKLDYPVYLDLEDEAVGRCSAKRIAEAAKTFCDITEGAGYFTGIYANRYWFEQKLTDPVFDRYARWLAEYANAPRYQKRFGMWQYSSKGSVAGIKGRVDMNLCYENYPELIKKAGLNGY